MPIRIATRASRLALWQAGHVAALLRQAAPEAAVEIVPISTIGDRDQTGSLRDLGGFGAFTREVQRALLDHRADLAVHSLKDLPTVPTAGLILAAVPERGDAADALVFPESQTGRLELTTLAPGARIGTGSLRRQAQLRYVRPDFQLREVRGNVETRLHKLDALEYDALVLAAAGLTRLGFTDRISRRLDPPLMYPAVGQGALGLECRRDDASLLGILAAVDDPPTHAAVAAERSLLFALEAGCHAPVGAATRVAGDQLILEAVVLSPDGRTRLHALCEAPLAQAEELGRQVAAALLLQGAAACITHP